MLSPRSSDTLAKMTNLRSLSISTKDYYHVAKDFVSKLTTLTRLTSLCIPIKLKKEDASYLTRLSRLQYLHFHHPDLHSLDWIVKLQHLHTLRLEDWSCYEWNGTQITSLTLTYCKEKHMTKILLFTQLKELRLLNNYYDAQLTQLTNLTSLGVGRFPSWKGEMPSHIKSFSAQVLHTKKLWSFTCLNVKATIIFSI